MQQKFDELIESFIKNEVGISVDFLPEELSRNLKKNLLNLFDSNQFKEAGIGNEITKNVFSEVRGDQIFWLDRAHNNPFENSFLDIIDAFILYLNETCFAGINKYEFHYTRYAAGSFYKKHVDQFANNDARQYSMIFYLNENWEQKNGGELRIFKDENVQDISPNFGKIVFFKSNKLFHEVLQTNVPRLSITGWLLR